VKAIIIFKTNLDLQHLKRILHQLQNEIRNVS